MWASEIRDPQVDHLRVLLKIAFLGEAHVAKPAQVRSIARVGPEMVKVLTHREYRETTFLLFPARFHHFMLALKHFEKSALGRRAEEEVDAVVARLRNDNI